MCAKCQAKLARAQVRVWCLEIAVAALRGTLFIDLIRHAAAASAQAQALDPSVVS